MIGMFSYRENVERQQRMVDRLVYLERKPRLTDQERDEVEHLRDWIAEGEAWLRDWQDQ